MYLSKNIFSMSNDIYSSGVFQKCHSLLNFVFKYIYIYYMLYCKVYIIKIFRVSKNLVFRSNIPTVHFLITYNVRQNQQNYPKYIVAICKNLYNQINGIVVSLQQFLFNKGLLVLRYLPTNSNGIGCRIISIGRPSVGQVCCIF